MWKIRIASALLATILTVASPAAQPPSGASPGDDALVLVVPFANLAGDPADDWIGVGIAEAVAIDLQVTGTPVVRATVEVRGDTGPGGVLDVGRQAGAGRVGQRRLPAKRRLDPRDRSAPRRGGGHGAPIRDGDGHGHGDFRAAGSGGGRTAHGSRARRVTAAGAGGCRGHRGRTGCRARTSGAVRPARATARRGATGAGRRAAAAADARAVCGNRSCRCRSRRGRPTLRRDRRPLRRCGPHRRAARAGAPGGDDP